MEDAERECSPLSKVCVCDKHTEEGRDRMTDSTLDFSLSTCLGAHREPYKERQVWKETERNRSGSKKRGLGEKEVRKGRYERIVGGNTRNNRGN